MPTYTRGDLKNRLNAGIKGKIGIMVDVDETINLAVRSVLSEVDLQSTRRMVDMVPGIFSKEYEYASPTDLKGFKVINVEELADEYRQTPYGLVTPTEFRHYRKIGTIAVDEYDDLRKILISREVDGAQQVVSTLDSTNAGGGTWAAYGDGTGVGVDTGNYVRGNGSIKFAINAAGGTTAGIANSTLDTFDYSPFDGEDDSILVWVRISDPTNITNFTIRYGDDATNYNEISVTQTHFGTAFAAGWNLLRFDVSSATQAGSPTATAGEYIALFMTKDAAKVSETGYNFDSIVFKKGTSHKLKYYSKYGWQDATTGAWKENSTSDSDYLNADMEEYNMYIFKTIELAGDEVDEAQATVNAAARYAKAVKEYTMEHPSEALLLTYDYQAQYYI
jgi:hypothetical protein